MSAKFVKADRNKVLIHHHRYLRGIKLASDVMPRIPSLIGPVTKKCRGRGRLHAAEAACTTRFRICGVSRYPVLPPLASTVSRRVRISLGGFIGNPTEDVDPLASTYFHVAGVHTCIASATVRVDGKLSHERQPADLQFLA